MALSYKARRRWALAILILALPTYILVASWAITLLGRPPILVELLIYVVMGVIWAIPLRTLFKGIGQADPDASDPDRR